MQYNKYMTPDDIAAMQEMASMDDPDARIDSMSGLQGMANGMRVKSLPERSNGRVWGATSPMEAIGGIAQNLASAYMQKDLADKYGGILDKANAARGATAKKIGSKYMVDALRNGTEMQPGANDYPTDAAGNLVFD